MLSHPLARLCLLVALARRSGEGPWVFPDAGRKKVRFVDEFLPGLALPASFDAIAGHFFAGSILADCWVLVRHQGMVRLGHHGRVNSVVVALA